MIKAIIFDFFGVLAVRGFSSFAKTYYPTDAGKIDQTQKLQDQLNLGSISYDDFISGLAKIGEVDRDKVLRYTENYQPNRELLDYIRTNLRPKYKLGIVSNAGLDWIVKILGPSNEKMFDDIVLSYKVGAIKPGAEIYNISAKNLGVKENECLFIDDILTYCQGAEGVGMKSIWYKSFDQMKNELETLLSASSNN